MSVARRERVGALRRVLVARGALREQRGRAERPVGLQPPLHDHVHAVGERVGDESAVGDRIAPNAVAHLEIDLAVAGIAANRAGHDLGAQHAPERVRSLGQHRDPAAALALSRERAQSVKSYLVANRIDADRIKVVGYGPTQPISSNDTEEGRVLGVLYVDNVTTTHRFGDEDLNFLIAFSGIAAVAIENSQFAERIRREALVRSNFERYFAPSLAARIANSPEASRLGGEKRTVAVLFRDIRGFTALSETMMACWLAFARNGNPDNPGIPHWPAYTLPQRATFQK